MADGTRSKTTDEISKLQAKFNENMGRFRSEILDEIGQMRIQHKTDLERYQRDILRNSSNSYTDPPTMDLQPLSFVDIASCDYSELEAETTGELHSDEELMVTELLASSEMMDFDDINDNNSPNSADMHNFEEPTVSKSGLLVLSIQCTHMASEWNPVLNSQPIQGNYMSVDVYYDHFCNWKRKLEEVDYISGEESYIDDFLYGLKREPAVRIWEYKWKPHTLYGAFCRALIEENMMRNDGGRLLEEMPHSNLIGIQGAKYVLDENVTVVLDASSPLDVKLQMDLPADNGRHAIFPWIAHIVAHGENYIKVDLNTLIDSELLMKKFSFDPGGCPLSNSKMYEQSTLIKLNEGDVVDGGVVLPVTDLQATLVPLSNTTVNSSSNGSAKTCLERAGLFIKVVLGQNSRKKDAAMKIMLGEIMVFMFDPGISSLFDEMFQSVKVAKLEEQVMYVFGFKGARHVNAHLITADMPSQMDYFGDKHFLSMLNSDSNAVIFLIPDIIAHRDNFYKSLFEGAELIIVVALGQKTMNKDDNNIINEMPPTLRVNAKNEPLMAPNIRGTSIAGLQGMNSLLLFTFDPGIDFLHLTGRAPLNFSEMPGNSIFALWIAKLLSCWNLFSDGWIDRVELESSSGAWPSLLSIWKAKFACVSSICAIFIHILEDKDDFKRVGKKMVAMVVMRSTKDDQTDGKCGLNKTCKSLLHEMKSWTLYVTRTSSKSKQLSFCTHSISILASQILMLMLVNYKGSSYDLGACSILYLNNACYVNIYPTINVAYTNVGQRVVYGEVQNRAALGTWLQIRNEDSGGCCMLGNLLGFVWDPGLHMSIMEEESDNQHLGFWFGEKVPCVYSISALMLALFTEGCDSHSMWQCHIKMQRQVARSTLKMKGQITTAAIVFPFSIILGISKSRLCAFLFYPYALASWRFGIYKCNESASISKMLYGIPVFVFQPP